MLDPDYAGPPTTFYNRACVKGFDYESPETMLDNCDDVSVPTSVDFLEEPNLFVGDDFVVVKWAAGSSMRAIRAFNLYRSESRTAWGRCSNPARSASSHEYRDNNVQRGRTYYYWIEIIGSDGPEPFDPPARPT